MSMALATAHPEAFCKAIVDIVQWNENAPLYVLILIIILLIGLGAIKLRIYMENRSFDEKTKKLIAFGISFAVAAVFMLFIIFMA